MRADWMMALGGGALIGVAASLLFFSHGRVAGISGILDGLFERSSRSETTWRILFIVGLAAGGFAAGRFDGPAPAPAASVFVLVIAGLLVGFGARLGNGCTSGHGVCGLSRFSRRSLVSVVTFMSVAALTVFVIRHMLGAQS